MPRKFDRDAKDRVVRLVEDRILAENMSMQQACKIVRGMLPGNGRRQPAVLGSFPEPRPEDVAAEHARIRRENHQLRDTNELLKAASGSSPVEWCSRLCFRLDMNFGV